MSMFTPETDEFGMSPYMVIRDLDAMAPHNIHIAKRPGRGDDCLSRRADRPMIVANFLAAPELYYARHFDQFARFEGSYEVLTPEDIRGMDLPVSMYGHQCPFCEAEWPEYLLRMQEALQEISISTDPATNQWASTSSGLEDLNKPDHWWHCNHCSETVEHDLAGRDLDELFDAMKARGGKRDRDRMMAEAAEHSKRLTREAIERGELCPHCESPMPNSLVAIQNANVVLGTVENEYGVWRWEPTSVSFLDDIEWRCDACGHEVECNDAWNHIASAKDFKVVTWRDME